MSVNEVVSYLDSILRGDCDVGCTPLNGCEVNVCRTGEELAITSPSGERAISSLHPKNELMQQKP